MRFYQNTVPMQGNKTLSMEEFAAKVLNKNVEPVVKTASTKSNLKVAEKEECDSSGQPEWEGKAENVNEPKDKSEEKTKKEAKWNFEKVKDSDDKEEKEDSDKKDSDKEEKEEKDYKCAEDNSNSTKKAEKEENKSKDSDEAPSSGQLEVEPLHQEGESENASKVNDSNKEASAAINGRLVKISKLDSKTKSMLVDYYKKYYPAEYVESLVKEN